MDCGLRSELPDTAAVTKPGVAVDAAECRRRYNESVTLRCSWRGF
jgi:hypothetical protein